MVYHLRRPLCENLALYKDNIDINSALPTLMSYSTGKKILVAKRTKNKSEQGFPFCQPLNAVILFVAGKHFFNKKH